MFKQADSTILGQHANSLFKNKYDEYIHPSFLLENQLLDAVTQGETEKALSILESIHKDKRPQLASHPVRSLKNSLIGSCTLFTRATIRGGVPPEKAFTLSDTYIRNIERQESMQALSNLEYDMLTRFSKMVNNSDVMPYSHIINQSISYINENILKDLSLHTISSHCHINPSYLSHLFKKEAGTSIVSYITQRRIQESQYYLLHTSNTISDIALLFNFCNQSYFSYQFKQYIGITPREFRDQRTSR